MGPKAKRSASSTPSKGCDSNPAKAKEDRLEQLQADHELFLQAFESKTTFQSSSSIFQPNLLRFTEPTQIYRYLRTRHVISPIFLNRNLTFMKKRMSRPSSNKQRQKFKVDSLLKRKEAESFDMELPSVAQFLNLTFLGYYDRKRKPSTLTMV